MLLERIYATMLLYISVSLRTRQDTISYSLYIYSSSCISSVQNLRKIGGKTWRKVGGKTWGRLERGGEVWRKDVGRKVGEDVEKIGERGGESCRKVRRVVGRRREEDVEREVGKICRKVFEERLAIVRY